ncbi:hypothetical protein V8C42DRAFT_359338 [Trichoderma barbatum]
MVGAAQYLDDEIGWVLSAVVDKKKQSYIQTHFKDKFGRSLNHNQIRYIKNKYGKDPRFNPLVNTRAPRIATSPKPGVPRVQEGEDGQGHEIDFGSPSEAGPSNQTGEGQGDRKNETVAATRMKRKRGADDLGDGHVRLIRKITGPQRPELQRDRASSKAVEYETQPQQWNALDLQLSVSHSAPATTLADNYHGTQYVETHDGTEQPNPIQFHNTSTGIGWTPSVSLSTWGTGNSPIFTSAGGSANPSALIHPSTAMEQLYHDPAEQTHVLFQTPVATQYQLQLPPTHLIPSSVSPFTPLTPIIAPSPYQSYQGQQQHQLLQREQELHNYINPPSTPAFPNLEISEIEQHPCQDALSSAPYQLIPSFQEMPIEPASSQYGAEPSALAIGDVREHH